MCMLPKSLIYLCENRLQDEAIKLIDSFGLDIEPSKLRQKLL